MLIPIFPKLGLIDKELASRTEALFEKTKSGDVKESVMAEFMNSMIHTILEDVIENPRVKPQFDKLPDLIGKKLSLHAEGLNPWLIEVVPAPKVLDVKISSEEEVSDLVGFTGSFEVIKGIVSDSASVDMLSEAIFEERLKIVNASPEEPVIWVRDLFSVVGPIWDRIDLIEKALTNAMPKIDEELKRWGC